MPAPSGRGRQKSTRPILEFLERGAQRKGKSIREITFEEFMNSPAMGFGGAGAIKAIRGVPGVRLSIVGKELSESAGETIAEAALRTKDRLFTGRTHAEAFEKGRGVFDKLKKASEVEQGFTTSTGRFVNRKEALEIAKRSGQTKNPVFRDRIAAEEAIKPAANISRPNTIAGKELRKNVGGQRPPDTELEALALKKQQAQRARRQRAGKVEDVNLSKPGTLEPEVVEEIAKKGFGDVLTPSDLMNEVVKSLRVTNPARATRAEAIQAELTGMKSRGLSGNRKEREQIKNLLAEFTRLLGE